MADDASPIFAGAMFGFLITAPAWAVIILLVFGGWYEHR
jgi:hypothetical protein